MKLYKPKFLDFSFTLAFLINFLILGCAFGNDRGIDHIQVYIDSPNAIKENQIDYLFKLTSDHSIFIGNKKKIKIISELLKKVLTFNDPNLKHKKFKTDLFINIEFYFEGNVRKELYVSKKGEFKYNGKYYGVIPEKLMKEIIMECESLVNIVDLRYQESILYNSKVKSLCLPSDLDSCM